MYRYGDPWILANFVIRTQRLQLAYHEETEAKLGDPNYIFDMSKCKSRL